MLSLPWRYVLPLCLSTDLIPSSSGRSKLLNSPLTLLHLLIQGDSFLRNPFDGERVIRTFFIVRPTHSYGVTTRLSCSSLVSRATAVVLQVLVHLPC